MDDGPPWRQADVLEQLARPPAPLGFRHVGSIGQLDVFGRRQHRQQEEALENEPDLTQPQQASLPS